MRLTLLKLAAVGALVASLMFVPAAQAGPFEATGFYLGGAQTITLTDPLYNGNVSAGAFALNPPAGDIAYCIDLAQSIGLTCEVVLIPVFGALSDLVGRKPVMIAALVLDLVVTYPLFSWVSASPSFGALLTMQIILCSLFGVFNGPISTALAEQFPTRVRSTALAISYNIAVMLFGGFAQFFVTWLIEATGTPIAPAYYLMFGAAVGLLAALFLRERAHDAQLLVTDVVEPTAA